MNTEQERAAFEAWYRLHHGSLDYGRDASGEYADKRVQGAFNVWQARAALQSQPTEAFPCRIIEADFETGTVTLEMHGKYTVSGGQKYLCDAPMQSQDAEDAERYRWLRQRWGRVTETYDGDSGRIVEIGTEPASEGWDIDPETLDAAIDAAIDRARLAERDALAALAQQPAAGVVDDTRRIRALADNYWRLEPFAIPTPGGDDADVGWRVIKFHRAEPRERIVVEHYRDNPREAIDAAINQAREKENGND